MIIVAWWILIALHGYVITFKSFTLFRFSNQTGINYDDTIYSLQYAFYTDDNLSNYSIHYELFIRP